MKITIAAAAVLALSLSACGIGGTFTLPVEPDPNEPNAASPSAPADAGPSDGAGQGDTGDNGGDSAQRLLILE